VGAGTPLRVGLLGATGLVGRELLAVLGERRFPVSELRAFASQESAGEELELYGEGVAVEPIERRRALGCDLLFCAAPGALEALLPALREAPTRVVDLSGFFELDPAVALQLPGWSPPVADEHARWIAIPRGPLVGLGLALGPLARRVPLERVTVVTLESASGCGRAGSEELSGHTLELLNAMSGETEPSQVFPQSLAFDCLPQVGDLLEDGETQEEARLRHVLRRLLERPELRVESTRVRVPTFSGSLTAVHASFAGEMGPGEAEAIWAAAAPHLERVESGALPTPRAASGTTAVVVGRARRGSDGPGSLAFALALDDLRRGSALSAVLAAEAWLGH
jgi:aspartate-semialdehyde dehydrogenase